MIKKLLIGLSCFLVLALLWIPLNGFLTDSKLIDSIGLSNRSYQKPEEFVLFTMPKTGTHLMRPLLENLTGKFSISIWAQEVDCPKNYLYDKNLTNLLLLLPNVVQLYWLHQPVPKESLISVLDDLNENNEFLVTHAPFSVEMESNLKHRNSIVFFLIRDPRDWVISVIRHPAGSGVDIFGAPTGDTDFHDLDMDEKIDHIINGTSTYYSVSEVYDRFLSWRKSPVCCSLRFEALLGPLGGRFNEKEQIAELRKIAKALKLDISDRTLLDAFEESFGVGSVFSKGKSSSWKEYFNEEHKEAFKEKLGDLLIELGYEKDYNW